MLRCVRGVEVIEKRRHARMNGIQTPGELAEADLFRRDARGSSPAGSSVKNACYLSLSELTTTASQNIP